MTLTQSIAIIRDVDVDVDVDGEVCRMDGFEIVVGADLNLR